MPADSNTFAVCQQCGIHFKTKPSRVRSGRAKFCSPACHYAHRLTLTPEQLWLHVEKTDGCWLWTGAKNARGYGYARLNGKGVFAHRLSWELTYSPVPDGLYVLHHCDNPACVRPDHLFLGTLADNNSDMVAKGRAVHPRGEDHPSSKLTTDSVLAMRALYAAGASQSEIVHRFQLPKRTVHNVIHRLSWRHV